VTKQIIWLGLFIILITSVHALGLAPARTTLEYKPDLVQEGKFRIIIDQVPAKVKITTAGDLGKYVELQQEVLVLTEPETWINFKIKMSSEIPPGERTGQIIVSEVPKDTGQENVVYAVPQLVHQLRTNVPFPEKYLSGKLYITSTEVQKPVVFTIALANWGKESVDSAKAVIVIKGPTNEEIAVLHTDEISIEALKEGKLIGAWNAQHAGKYFVEVNVEYDGRTLQLSDSFNVGNLEIEIERIAVNNFKIGQIAKFDIYLRNKWNQPLDVDGRIEVFKSNQLVSTFNTVPVHILQGSTSVMNAYWNTEGVGIGEYDITVTAQYSGKTSQKTFSSIVSIDSIQFKDFISAQAVSTHSDNRTTILIVAVFILIIVNILLFIYISKIVRKR